MRRHVAAEVAGSSDRVMASAREAFTSYGSCSILEPLEDLVGLHLVTLDDRSHATAPAGAPQ